MLGSNRVVSYVKAHSLLALVASIAAIFPATTAMAAAFDVELATRAYLDLLPAAARERSDAYFEGGYWLLLWGTLAAILADALILRTGLARSLRDRARRWLPSTLAQDWLTALGYLTAGAVLTLPWAVYAGFLRERDYGLLNQTFGQWLGEHALNTAITLGFMPVIVAALLAAMRRAPRFWWVWGAGIMTGIVGVMLFVSPVYVAPLFNTYVELPAGPVRDRIVAMAEAHGVPAGHIHVYDASRQTSRISANVSGLGPTVRISLNDNLLNHTGEAEIASVMGHELGHYVLGHNWRLLVTIGLLTGIVFYLLHRLVPAILARFGGRWGVQGMADAAALPVYGMMVSAISLLATPVTNSLIRINENAADAFGLEAAREPDGMAMVAIRLSQYRKLEPHWLEEWLFFDHPSGAVRVRRAMEWKARNVANARMETPKALQPPARNP